MEELTFSLEGNQVKCKIGFGVILAATDHLKKKRARDFADQKEAIAQLAESDADRQVQLQTLAKSHYEHQVPTEAEVRDWLLSTEGIHFALIYGTRRSTLKLNDETASIVLDEMADDMDQYKKLTKIIAEVCHGTEAANIGRKTSETLNEIAALELQGLINRKDALAKFVEQGRTSLAEESLPEIDAEPTSQE